MATPSPLRPASSEMDVLLQSQTVPQLPQVGDIIHGTVVSVSKNEALIDIGGITTGVVRGREMVDESGVTADIKAGDEVEATVLELENENGQVELSFRSAGHQKAWDELTRLLNSGEVIDVPIVDANRGGLMATVGRIEGFLPVSQLTPEHYPRVEGGDKSRILEALRQFAGQIFRVKVIDVNEAEEKLIVSEKAAWAKEHAAIVSGYKVGDVIEGKVTGVVDFGAFVEFGQHLEGLIHISELAWQRVDNPRDILKVGDQVQAVIIGIDGTKISLSLKRLKDDPWKKAVEKYSVGQVVKGKVLKLNPFGAFVELDEEIHGLAHISELSKKPVRNPSDVVKEGETKEFKIISIEPESHRLGLSMKALEEDAAPKTADGERVSDPALAG
ncbi:MAG: S1 RNA-binding domain-containing protein, partial [Candidatus Kerfeldbacteria bacterium]|nr:S1 RNA-binding domain-containing protein [Candidatus Kerfeldbacteria bacterium]